MGKSILVMDTPKSCSECVFRSYNDCGHCILNGKIHFVHIKYNKKRHPQCPLPDTTELLEKITDILNELEDTGSIKVLIPTLNKLYKFLRGDK